MTATRFVCQADEKINVICATLHRHGALATADAKALARKADIPYTTLTTAVQRGRFSADLEEKLARIARFEPAHSSWVNDSIPEWKRRDAAYLGSDTAERFRAHLNEGWLSASISFRTARGEYKAFDPHMGKHHLSDGLQATPAGSTLQLFLAAHFQPFHHRSGIRFGFRKAAVLIEIDCDSTRSSYRLGYPEPTTLANATLQGEAESPLLRWTIECNANASDILSGEYATKDMPLVALAGYRDGSALVSAIDVNIFDRKSFVAEGLDLSVNKQELIEQIFLRELPSAEARNGWITISCERIVIARYGQ